MLDSRLIDEIQKLTNEIKIENKIENKEIIRDDVFNILQNLPDCIVLYYPIDLEADEDGCDGCHVIRCVKGKKKQLVFINTANTRERQAFSVAHELGHIWEVDKKIKERIPNLVFDSEDVINRFAAELLMPEGTFQREAIKKLDELSIEENGNRSIRVVDFIKIIVYLMNYFFAPFKAVVLRLDEVGIGDKATTDLLLKYKDSEYVKSIIVEEQYTRLGIKTDIKSVSNLAEKINEIEEKHLFSDNKIKVIRDLFDLSEIKVDAEMKDKLNIKIP